MTRAELESRVEELEEAVAYLALDKKSRSKVPPPRFITVHGYIVGPHRDRR